MSAATKVRLPRRRICSHKIRSALGGDPGCAHPTSDDDDDDDGCFDKHSESPSRYPCRAVHRRAICRQYTSWGIKKRTRTISVPHSMVVPGPTAGWPPDID